MLNRTASLAMSTSGLEALPGKLDIKRHSSSIIYLQGFYCRETTHLWLPPPHKKKNNLVKISEFTVIYQGSCNSRTFQGLLKDFPTIFKD